MGRERIEFNHNDRASDGEAHLLFEDDDLLILSKPAGWLTEGERSATSFARGLTPSASPVHRLDKGTSGLLLFAKNPSVLKLLEDLFRERRVMKRYLAVVHGRPHGKKGVVDNVLEVSGRPSGQTRFAKSLSNEGKRARTRWEVVAYGEGVSVVACYPETGRTHQIRVHLASLGAPIVGDTQYGGRLHTRITAPYPLLHAHKLEFEHPRTKAIVAVESEVPPAIGKYLQRAETIQPPP